MIAAFDLSLGSGPICDEPVQGVAFVIQYANFEPFENTEKEVCRDPHGPIAGQCMSVLGEAYKEAFFSRSVRLVEPM